MKRSDTVKFPNSVELFKFCQKVLSAQRNTKINDQEVGNILEFNPSDCSHWKRGEKNVKSVFALAHLASYLKVEESLIHDIASSLIGLDEAYFEYLETSLIKETQQKASSVAPGGLREVRARVEAFVEQLHRQVEFATPPLYLPEVLRFFSFISTQSTDMVEKLSRILRLKAGKYVIQFRKGDLKPQTRMSMTRDLARIIFEGERARFPELAAPSDAAITAFEELVFMASLLVPKRLLIEELAKVSSRKNVVAELASIFWVPKVLVAFQLQEIIKSSDLSTKVTMTRESEVQAPWKTANAS